MSNTEEDKNSPSSIHLSIPFPSEEAALIVKDILCVDRELRRSAVKRQISTVRDILIIEFQGEDLKKLRVSLNSILKNILLILQTFQMFENQ